MYDEHVSFPLYSFSRKEYLHYLDDYLVTYLFVDAAKKGGCSIYVLLTSVTVL